MGDKYIAWLSDLSKKDLKLAGGKGANLGEIFNAKFPVPQAFVVTTDAFFHFLKEAKLEQKIKDILNQIKVDETKALTTKAKEIRELITQSEMPQNLQVEIIEAYDHFNVDLNEIKNSPGALSILRSSREPVFVSVRSSATAEDQADASFAGQQSSFINIKGNKELIQKVKECFASIFTARAIFYRKKKQFEGLVGIAAVVQKMINSDKSGVMFSRHPVKNDEEILIEAVFGQGEGIVSGKIKPDQYTTSRTFEITEEKISDKKIAIIRTSGGLTKTIQLTPEKSKQRVLKTYEIKQLAEFAIKLEDHYKKPQDIEFAIENENIYILQTRPITTIKQSDKETVEIDGQLLTQGMAASPGIASGIVKIINSMDDLDKIKQGDILVTTMTNPDMVVSMQKAAAILTTEGGVTAHAAIVSREMGIPAIVGAQDALNILKDGDEITIDGFHGKVFAGKAQNKAVEILPVVETKTKIKVMVDLPQFAERAAKTQADGIGLIRLEGLIATAGKHPIAYEKENKLDEYQAMLTKGLKEIADKFIGKPIWVRSSDIRSDEYANLKGAPKETEANPMLGDHGIRFSLKHPKILKAELLAIKELADKGHKFGVMFPQIISVDEVKKAKAIFNELQIDNVAFGVMIETPAATILIKDICEQKIDFISFGTNDLTQYTLAIDRGNEEVQNIYDEMNWAVLKQISRVIRECKKHKIETSICGQAGSKPEMVEFLIKQGIDSISVNADAAKSISELVHKLETEPKAAKPPINTQSEASTNSPPQNSHTPIPQTPNPHKNKTFIEPIDNKESIKEEIQERETKLQEAPKGIQEEVEQLKEKYNNPEIPKPESDIEIVESDDAHKKEDIFN